MEDDLKIYCGMKPKLPKGTRRGTFPECLKMKQIRYYGMIDSSKEIFNHKEKNGAKDTYKKLHITLAGINGALRKFTKDLQYARDDEKRLKIEEQIAELKKTRNKVIETMNSYKEQFGDLLRGM